MKDIKKVCIVNNLYCLLLFMLINRKNREEETFYFFDDDIPIEISNNFANHYHFYTPNSNIGKIFFVLKLRILRRFLFSFLYNTFYV